MNCKLQTWVQIRGGAIVQSETVLKPHHFTSNLLARKIPLNNSQITTLANFLKKTK